MKSKFIEDVVLTLIGNAGTMGIAAPVRMDYLPHEGQAISVWQMEKPKVERAFINGSRILQGSFKVLAQSKEDASNSTVNLALVSQLEAVGAFFEAMDNFSLSAGRTALGCESTMPTIISREENGTVVYGITIDCRYKEA